MYAIIVRLQMLAGSVTMALYVPGNAISLKIVGSYYNISNKSSNIYSISASFHNNI